MKKLSDFGVVFHKTELQNGARLVLFEKKGAPIHIKASFASGSRFGTIPGTAHFLEHMVLAGTERFPSKNLIAEHIQRVGGDFGGMTGPDLFNLWVEIPEKEDLGVGIEVLSQCLTKTLFSDKTLETERGAILTELNDNKSNPKAYLREVRRRLLMKNTPLFYGGLGTEESVKKISKEVLLEFQKKYLVSDRLCFVACGNIEFEELKQALGSMPLPRGERFTSSGFVPISTDQSLEVEKYPGSEHLHVSLASRVELIEEKDIHALELIMGILAWGRGSRLMNKLRYENGFVYTISGDLTTSVDWGFLYINFSCSKKNFERAKEIIFQEIEDVRSRGVSSTELEDIKNRVSKGVTRSLQTSDSWVSFHARDAAMGQKIITPDEYVNLVQDIEMADIVNVAKKYMDKNTFLTAICGDY